MVARPDRRVALAMLRQGIILIDKGLDSGQDRLKDAGALFCAMAAAGLTSSKERRRGHR